MYDVVKEHYVCYLISDGFPVYFMRCTLTSTSIIDIGICDICFVCLCPAVGGGGGEWCQSPYTYDSGSNTCFWRVPVKQYWHYIVDTCNQHNPDEHLVVINDAAKQTAVQNFIQGQHSISYRKSRPALRPASVIPAPRSVPAPRSRAPSFFLQSPLTSPFDFRLAPLRALLRQ